MKPVLVVLALCLLALALGGCGAASRQNVAPRHYTLGPLANAATQISPHSNGAILRIARIEMPAWLQGTGLYYRLAYRNGSVIAAYANSDWAAPPAAMLEQRLRSALADGGWRAVVGPASNAQADFTLHVSVEDFSQVFTSPGASFGVLDATVTLDGAGDALVAQRHFHFRGAAPSADAAGGVEALDAASRDFARGLRDWLRAQQPNRSLRRGAVAEPAACVQAAIPLCCTAATRACRPILILRASALERSLPVSPSLRPSAFPMHGNLTRHSMAVARPRPRAPHSRCRTFDPLNPQVHAS